MHLSVFALSRLSRNHLGNSSQRTSGQARWHDAYHASYTRTSSYIRSACGCILFFASFRCIRLRNSFPPHVLLRYCGTVLQFLQYSTYYSDRANRSWGASSRLQKRGGMCYLTRYFLFLVCAFVEPIYDVFVTYGITVPWYTIRASPPAARTSSGGTYLVDDNEQHQQAGATTAAIV